uniref:Hemolymph juvenile hormone binding protein n=1 Tax=Anopheles culicifacies TaxID=139723 RepID=A0A182MLU0_9DIPT
MARGVITLLWINLICVISVAVCAPDDPKHGHGLQAAGEMALSEQLFAIIDLYKQEDPVGLPGATIPDPMPIPEIKQSFSFAKMHLRNVLAHGMSRFRIRFFRTELNSMSVTTQISIDEITVNGNYTMSTFFNRAEGPFTVLMRNVLTKANVSLAVERDGTLRTKDIELDIAFDDMAMDFQNLGFMGSIFQSVVNSASNLVYDTMKPFMLSEAYTKIREEVDTRMLNITVENEFTLPNSISPLDMAIGEMRALVRSKGLDPFHVPEYNNTAGIFGMQTMHTWISGGSSFYRYGDISVTMQNNSATLGMSVATQRIVGSTQWEISIGRGMLSHAGRAQFTVEHIRVEFQVVQPLDLRKKLKLQDLQLELGNIQVRCDGAGTFDYVIEAAVNILPNLLRYQIMDAIENPLRMRIQEKLDCIDTEALVRKYAKEFEKNGLNIDLQDFELCEP